MTSRMLMAAVTDTAGETEAEPVFCQLTDGRLNLDVDGRQISLDWGELLDAVFGQPDEERQVA